MDEQRKFSFSIDWRWVVAGYCYLVLFHLFPTYLMNGFSVRHLFIPPEGTINEASLATIWLMGGVGVVAFIVGWKSRGMTILEPAFSGTLYGITMAAGYRTLITSFVHDRPLLTLIFWILMVMITSATCAWIGEAVQSRQLAKARAVQP